MRVSLDRSMDAPNKLLARISVFGEVALHLAAASVYKPRVLIIAGPRPQHEVRLCKRLLGAHVTAIDVNAEFLPGARRAGADDVRLASATEVKGSFDFVNLDTCKLVCSGWVGPAFKRVGAEAAYVATWTSYGHEVVTLFKREYREGLSAKLAVDHSSVDPDLWYRLVYLWQFAVHRGELRTRGVEMLRPVKVWRYCNGGTRMLVCLWRRSADGSPTTSVGFEVISEKAATTQQRRSLAAWRAVETRTGRCSK